VKLEEVERKTHQHRPWAVFFAELSGFSIVVEFDKVSNYVIFIVVCSIK